MNESTNPTPPMVTRPQAGILGLGAMGTVMAAQLALQDEWDLHFFNRSPRPRIQLKLPNGRWFEKAIHCLIEPAPVALDWLIICLKEHHYAQARHWFEALIGPHTRVVIVRNGLELTAPLLPFTTSDHLLPCLVDCPTEQIAYGSYHQLSQPVILTLPDTPLANRFRDVLPATSSSPSSIKTSSPKAGSNSPKVPP
ncbi:MAG: 2-dehydropantoate 2-reductase N-terminal domain-containing protein [Saprospiraceae bacterium]